MQNELLTEYSSPKLSIYAVWLPMLWSDSREMWNGTTMSDTRVIHFWDGEFLAGEWFARQVDGYEGIAWDVYYLYGPDATWDAIPSPLIGSGGTIYRERNVLEAEVRTLLQE